MLNPTFRQLQAFLAVTDTGSFAKAGERLGVSQPGVSKHIKLLEEQCGGPLFVRTAGQRSELTKLGSVLLIYAPRLMDSFHELSKDIEQVLKGAGGRSIRITGHSYVMENLVRPIVADFTAAHPEISIEIATWPLHPECVLSDADFAFIVVADDRQPEVEVLHRMECGFYVGAPHPLATTMSMPAIADSFILPIADTSFEAMVVNVLETIGIRQPRAAARAQLPDVIKTLVLKGVGAAYLPVALMGAEEADGSALRLDVEAPPLFVALISRTRLEQSEAARSFADFARKAMANDTPNPSPPQPVRSEAE